MKIFLTACLSFLSIFSSMEAVLPPLYEGAKEIRAMLKNRELDQKLESGEVITTIQKNEKGYEIITNKHRVQVDVIYQPNAHPGPARFELQFHEAEAL